MQQVQVHFDISTPHLLSEGRSRAQLSSASLNRAVLADDLT